MAEQAYLGADLVMCLTSARGPARPKISWLRQWTAPVSGRSAANVLTNPRRPRN